MARVLSLTLFLCIGCPADVLQDDTDTEDPEWPNRFDDMAEAFETERKSLNAPGVAVAVWQDGEVVFSHGFGSGHPDKEEAIAGDTLFRIGSITKMMTAAALLGQIEAGNVGLADTLTEALPELNFSKDSERTDNIQLHHLMTHQGGFYDWIEIDGSADDGHLSSFIHTTFAQNEVFIAPAATFYNYSNPNYMIAGLVAETADGARSYPTLLAESVFQPLGMDRTFFKAEAVLDDDNYATGRTIDWTGETDAVRLADPTSYDHAATRPAGYAWSSAEQLLLFAQFLMRGHSAVLTETTRPLLTVKHVDTLYYPDLQYYGYGVTVMNGFFGYDGYYETPVWEHSGAIYGYSAQLLMLPDHDFAIAVLANSDGGYFGGSIATAVETLVTDLPSPGAVPDPKIDPSIYARYVGQYMDPNNIGQVDIGLKDGVLTIEAPTLAEYGYVVAETLTPTAEHNFQMQINNVAYPITFVDGTDGAPSMYLRNRIFVAERQDSFVPFPSNFDPKRFDVALQRPTAPPLFRP